MSTILADISYMSNTQRSMINDEKTNDYYYFWSFVLITNMVKIYKNLILML